MFSCFQASRGSRHKKAKRGRLVCFWRRLIRPLTHFRHASRWELEVFCENEQEPDSMPNHPRFNYKSREYVQQMIDYIPAAIQNRDHLCLDIFVAMYQTYATTWEVLDLLMKTYASFRPDCAEDQQTKSAIFSFLFGWFQKFPQDFYESPDLAVLSQFTEYVRLNVPSLDVDTQAREPPSMLEDQEAISLKLEEVVQSTYVLPVDCNFEPNRLIMEMGPSQSTLEAGKASSWCGRKWANTCSGEQYKLCD
ncbi:uncharacterized protein LOC110293981 [Mus caroli]|uniref:Uncharacterized protein LOC110293981 n=1 Tax=Mus caroli TaxID=10089 RepID=A0A6P7R8A3_MUSCR|nr:uncharacterized protein LOC110293981 [Mus caroli]